jgi:hypothetical protein
MPGSSAREWPVYHAAVAAGLAGDLDTSEALFKRLIDELPATEWQEQLRADSEELARCVRDEARFRALVLAIIQESRTLHGLPPDPMCLDAQNS